MSATKTSPRGTCQVCFRRQVAKPKRGQKGPRMVVHGYNRPGYGAIEGECPGHGEVPFELSCEVTKCIRNITERHIEGIRKRLQDAQTGRTKSLSIEVRTGRDQKSYQPTYEIIEIEPGWENTDKSFYSFRTDTWDTRLREHIAQLQRDERRQQHLLDDLTTRIAEWRYNPDGIIPDDVAPREIDLLRGWYESEATQKAIDDLGLRDRIEHLGKMGWATTRNGDYTKTFYKHVKVIVQKAQAQQPAPRG